jgi:hypothetical protein
MQTLVHSNRRNSSKSNGSSTSFVYIWQHFPKQENEKEEEENIQKK